VNWGALIGKLKPAGAEASGFALPVRDGIQIRDSQPSRAHGFDLLLVWVVVCLLALGLVMVYSASIALPDNPRFAAPRRRTSWPATCWPSASA